MKGAELGAHLLWKGEPAKIVGLINDPAAVIQLERPICEFCGHSHITVVISSPLYQEGAEPIKTISNK